MRFGCSLWHFFLSFFLLLPKGEKYVDRAAKSLEEELRKVKTEGDRSRYKRCCLYRDRAEDWPLRAPPARHRGTVSAHRKTDAIGSLLYFIIIIFYFPENSGAKEIPHIYKYIGVEGIKDSLRMHGAATYISHLIHSLPVAERSNGKTNFCGCCDYSATTATPYPRVRPVTSHILQPSLRLLSF